MKKFIIALLLVAGIAEASHFRNVNVTNTVDVFVKGTNGVAVKVDSSGQMHTVMSGAIDTNNNTTATLLANESYTGVVTDVSGYSTIALIVTSDVASTNRGLKIQFSPDQSDWHTGEEYTLAAGAEKFYSIPIWSKYYRIIYKNGAVGQSSFGLHPFLRKVPSKYSSHNVIDSIADEDDAELVTSVLKAKQPSGTYTNINATVTGNLKTANVEDGLSIALGDVSDRGVLHKFGAAQDFDQADGEVTVWDGAEDGTAWELMNYVYSDSANIDSLSSSSTSDVYAVEVQGLGASTNLVVQQITMTGQTRVALSTNLYRVFRIKNVSSSNFTGHVFAYITNAVLSAGVPTDNASIRAVVQPENNQTEMAVYTVAAGKKLAVRRIYAFTAGASKSSEYIIRVYARPPGQVFQLKFRGAMSDTATSNIDQPYPDPLVFTEGTDIEMTVEIPDGTATAAAVTGGFSGVLVDN